MVAAELLSQHFELGFTYTRSTGPVVGKFLTGLREGRVYGVRGSDGRVLVPPAEYDPLTGAALGEFVEVGQQGRLLSWCWVSEPREAHHLQQPFAWAMVQLDGADVAMIHYLEAPSAEAIRSGARVGISWAAEREGFITDIRCFTLLEGAAP